LWDAIAELAAQTRQIDTEITSRDYRRWTTDFSGDEFGENASARPESFAIVRSGASATPGDRPNDDDEVLILLWP